METKKTKCVPRHVEQRRIKLAMICELLTKVLVDIVYNSHGNKNCTALSSLDEKRYVILLASHKSILFRVYGFPDLLN